MERKNVKITALSDGSVGNKRFRAVKETGEIKASNSDDFYPFENIIISWTRFNPDTKEDNYLIIKDENGKGHRVTDEKRVTVPADVLSSMFSLKEKK